jgi:hypothetical protein
VSIKQNQGTVSQRGIGADGRLQQKIGDENGAEHHGGSRRTIR